MSRVKMSRGDMTPILTRGPDPVLLHLAECNRDDRWNLVPTWADSRVNRWGDKWAVVVAGVIWVVVGGIVVWRWANG